MLGLASLSFYYDLDVWQISAIVTKAFTYGASFAASGGVFFLAIFSGRLTEQENASIKNFISVTGVVGIVLSLFRVCIMSAMMTGDVGGLLDGPMLRMVVESTEGPATFLHVAGLLTIVLLVRRSQMRAGTQLIASFGGVVAVASFALVGHAGEVAIAPQIKWLPQLLVSLHLVTVAFWIGALWPLHRLTYGDSLPNIAAVSHRFGQYAAAAVGILLLCGIWLLWIILGTPKALWSSEYGTLFVIKMFWVALLLGLAALNKTRLTPRLMEGDWSAIRTLRFSIRSEIVLALLILATTAILTTAVGPDAS
ncbi:copper resistance D family protein [Herbaspirillum sp. RV1423]|uniref:copper resistance D family protein n=1 Tax=Herbaspirillum sp. RV1423 TaxID=1443993 RepID=UPI0005551399|nr:CopD family protein [Herbaspirillum sp. RV1423]